MLKDDRNKADLLCSQLEQAGIRCWIAPRDVRPGRNWSSEIIRGLDNAKVMIVVLSASSNRSRPVIKEAERAFGKEIVIIPVRCSVTDEPDGMPRDVSRCNAEPRKSNPSESCVTLH
jgi:TIR domain